MKKELTVEMKFTLIKKEETKNIHGDKFLALHYRCDMPGGRKLFLEPVHVGFHTLDRLDETWLRTLLMDAMPWNRAMASQRKPNPPPAPAAPAPNRGDT